MLDMALLHDGSTSIAVVDENNELYQTGGKKLKAIPKDFSAKKIENADYIGWRMPSEYSSLSYVVVSNKETLLRLSYLSSACYHIRRRALHSGGIARLLIPRLPSARIYSADHQQPERESVMVAKGKYAVRHPEPAADRSGSDPESFPDQWYYSGLYGYCFVLADVSFEKDKRRSGNG